MIYDDTLRKAAKRAEKAVKQAMAKYADGDVTDEDDITGVLVGNLDTQLTGQIGQLTWKSRILRHRKGAAAEEKALGADMLIHVAINSPTLTYSKGVLIQSKRSEPGHNLSNAQAKELRSQCGKMLAVTPSAFVFNYAKRTMRTSSATLISGLKDIDLNADTTWTSYRFFWELFRCPIGDNRITSTSLEDLPNTVLKISASSG